MSQQGNILKPLQGLVELGQREDLEIRPVLLRVLTDMFVSRPTHSREELKQFEAIVLGLVDHTDPQTLQIIAGKLAHFGATPPTVAARLMAEGGEGRRAFLAHSCLVGRADLMRAAKEGEPIHAAAVAGRPDLDAEIVGALARRPELDVARALTNNFSAPLDDSVAAELIARQPRDAELARALCQRFSSAELLAPLFLYASPGQRAEIILSARRANFGVLTRPPRDFRDAAIAGEIERAAIAGDKPLLTALLARGLSASLADANEIVDDPRGEPLALALAALRVPGDASARIFMRLDPAISHSIERVRALTQLVIDVAPGAAQALMTRMLAPPVEKKRPTHVPVADWNAADAPGRKGPSAQEVLAPQKRPGLLLLRRRA